MAPYKILKQGYIMKEPPASKRGLRKVLKVEREQRSVRACNIVYGTTAVSCARARARQLAARVLVVRVAKIGQENYLHSL